MNIDVVAEGLEKLVKKLETWGQGIIEMIPNLLLAILVVIIFWVLSRWVYNMMRSFFSKVQLNKSLEHLIANTCRIIVICLGVVIALAVLELQKTVFSLLAGVGVIGLALGFAFQDLAANFMSGIMLAVRAPLKIGDVVEINGVQGTVEDIRLRDTLIRNFSGQDVFIPNKDFTSNKFTNYSSYGQRRIKIEVGIGYEDDPTKGLEVMTAALAKVDGILDEPAPEAFVGELAGSSVNLFGHIWFTYPGGSYFQIQSDAITLVKQDLEAAGFNIPFPIRTLDVPDNVVDAIRNKPSKSDS